MKLLFHKHMKRFTFHVFHNVRTLEIVVKLRPNISCRCRYAALTSTSYFCYLYYVCRYVLVRFYLKSFSGSNLAPNKYTKSYSGRQSI